MKMSFFNNSIQLSDSDFQKFNALIYKNSGIHLHIDKKSLINTRLGKIIREKKINSYDEYYNIIIKDNTGSELITFLDAITTNLTYFFRENGHFVSLKEELIPDIISRNKSNINIWSAGCSSGEEPYSIALTTKEYFPNLNVTILATDLSSKVLERAEAGIYNEREFEKVPSNMIKKYFQYGTGKWKGTYKVKNEIRNMITFKRMSLLDSLRYLERFDIIFCRNVLIYFDNVIQEQLVSNFTYHLYPKGYLITGHSESLLNLKHSLKYIRPTIYKKE